MIIGNIEIVGLMNFYIAANKIQYDGDIVKRKEKNKNKKEEKEKEK